MTTDIVNQMGQKAAMSKANDSISGLLSGLGAAIPYFGIATGIGFLADQLFGGNKEPEVPDFSSTAATSQISKFGGTIKAEDVKIEISPTFIIEGQQVFIGSGSIVEFVDESTELLKKSIQQAIENKEFDLSLSRS
jgi:hypothetical protein